MSAIETALTELSANLRRMEQRHQAVGYKFDRLYDLIDAAREELAGTAHALPEPDFCGFKDDDNCRVDMCFSPSAPRGDGTFATAYYTEQQVRALLATGGQAQAVEQTTCASDERAMNSGEPGSLMSETPPALGKTNAGQYSWGYVNPPIFKLHPKAPSKFTIWIDQRVVVTCYSNGRVEIAEGCDLNEAARVFWECVQKQGMKLASDAAPQAQADARDVALSKSLLALESCKSGTYTDVDGDTCRSYRFDRTAVAEAIAAIAAAKEQK